MPVQHVHSFLVHAAKNLEDQPVISGTEIHAGTKIHTMLSGVFERSHQECNIEIVFRPNAEGQQQNDCRDLLVAYANAPTIPHGRAIANRLQAVTTLRSGLGLLFLIKGEVAGMHQLVISRFPADEGVLAEENARRLEVKFIERIFMKSAKTYKSAFYSSDSLERGFWDGRAVDLQISGARELSDYWILEFLASELRTTGPAGTKRLAVALRDAVRATKDDLELRQELIGAATLLSRQDGRRQSARQLVDRLGLSEAARTALQAGFPRADLMDETFQFDNEEFRRHALYRGVELDNGALMIAEDSRFEQVFRKEDLNQAEGRVRYSTEGHVANEYLRKQK